MDSTPLRLADRYRLDEEFGRGQVATVWRGWDELLSRPVAVKVVRASMLNDAMFCARFLEEARAAARLDHPGIVAVSDFGEAPIGAGRSIPFIVMELLEGQDLAARLAGGPLPWQEAARIGGQAAQALAYAHDAGVAHEGLRPSNVFLTPSGVKVLDFGTARALGRPGGDGPADDVRALGVLLTEAMTGKPKGALPASVPPPLAALCERCAAPDPALRPSAAEAAAALAAINREVPVVAALDGPAARAVPPRPAAAPPGVGSGARKGALVAVGALAVVLAVALALGLSSSGGGAKAPPVANGLVVEQTSVALEPDTPGPSVEPTSPKARPTATPTAVPEPTRSATPSPSRTASPSPSTSAPEPPPAEGSAAEVLSRAQRSVTEGVYAREVRPDVGEDLNNTIGNLRRDVESGQPVDLRERIGEIRFKLYIRARERGLTWDRAREIDQILSEIDTGHRRPHR